MIRYFAECYDVSESAMNATDRSAFMKLLQSVDLSLPEYINARRQPEPAPSRGANDSTTIMYKKFKWPGECCTPNHPTLYDADSWHCASNSCAQPDISDVV
jgi:hypothetical protein